MKTIKEIINDLVEFAEANDMIGDGHIHIEIGDFKVDKSIPVNGDREEVPTVEKVLKNVDPKDKRAAARARFMGCGNVESGGSFDKLFDPVDDDTMKKAIKESKKVEV